MLEESSKGVLQEISLDSPFTVVRLKMLTWGYRGDRGTYAFAEKSGSAPALTKNLTTSSDVSDRCLYHQ